MNIVKLHPQAVIPAYATPASAGADLCACLDAPMTIAPQETVLIPTGLAMEIPMGYGGFIYARSGLASKKNLAPANKVGVIDSDYRGPVMVPLHNHGATVRTIEPGDRIAQLVVAPVMQVSFDLVENLSDTVRGQGGFGSTGV